MTCSTRSTLLAAMAAAMLFAAPDAGLAADYPPLYRELGLPEYPDAAVIETGRDNTSLADGIKVTLQTSATRGELRAFYEAAMADLGWMLQETPAAKNMRKAGMLDKLPFSALFCREDGAAYQVMATETGAQSAVRISVTQGANGC